MRWLESAIGTLGILKSPPKLMLQFMGWGLLVLILSEALNSGYFAPLFTGFAYRSAVQQADADTARSVKTLSNKVDNLVSIVNQHQSEYLENSMWQLLWAKCSLPKGQHQRADQRLINVLQDQYQEINGHYYTLVENGCEALQ